MTTYKIISTDNETATIDLISNIDTVGVAPEPTRDEDFSSFQL